MLSQRTITAVVALALSIALCGCQAASPSVPPIQTNTAPSASAERTATSGPNPASAALATSQTASTPTPGVLVPKLDGIYETSFTWDDLAASPFLVGDEIDDEENWGDWQLTFADGRFSYTQGNEFASSSSSGTFEVTGDSVLLKFDAGTNAGETIGYRWSVDDNVLTFARNDGLGVPGPTPFLVKSWRRASASTPTLLALATSLNRITGDRIVFYPAGDSYWPPRPLMIDSDGSNVIALAERGSMPGIASPDGSEISILRFVDYDETPPIKDYWGRPALINPDGTGLRVLDGYPGRHNLVPLGWSADGALLYVYSGFDASDSNEMGTFTVRSSDGGGPEMVLPASSDKFERPDFVQVSPDGQDLLVNRQAKGGDSNEFIFEVSGRKLRQINPTGTQSCEFGGRSIYEGSNSTEVWSPDSSAVAFCGYVVDDDSSALYVASRDGADVQQIVPVGVGAVTAAWSPDGTEIAFTSRLRSNPQVWVVRPDGSGLKQLTDGSDGSQSLGPRWSPDGTRLLFERQLGTATTLWEMAADGTGQRQVSATPLGPDHVYAWWPAI